MVTRQQIDAAIERLERLVEGQFQPLGATATPEGAADGLVPWQGLSRPQQESVLTLDADWQGFTAAQEADVIRRVLDGEEADFWMDGVEPDAASPQRSSSHGAMHMADDKHALEPLRITGQSHRDYEGAEIGTDNKTVAVILTADATEATAEERAYAEAIVLRFNVHNTLVKACSRSRAEPFV